MKTKNVKISRKTIAEIYYEDISIYKKRSRKKINMDDFIIPRYRDFMKIVELNYNVKQLKEMCKEYKLKISGCKNELKYRVFNYLKFSYYAQKIQTFMRGNFVRILNKLKGPAYKDRNCINDTDFLMFEKVKSIPNNQFYSYKDNDGFIYGFNICSIYNLLYVENIDKKALNPYNRNIIQPQIYDDVKHIVKLSNLLGLNTNIKVKNDFDLLSFKKKVELKCVNIFQKIDELGNNSHYKWFYDLSKPRMLKFMNELIDIWNYRLNLTNELKRNICSPTGKPFEGLNIPYLFSKDMDTIKNSLLNVLDKLITKGIDRQLKSLGAYYILGALTLVSIDAAATMPWLYETFRY